ncbi:glycosyltransferase family 4 protein [Patescibacteria group bacterium]|nr:glycosyltransferase family 4 protein [Patescibacteria group bacterium]
MLVAVDCRFAGIQDAGIGRYTRELVRELIRVDSDQKWILFVQSRNEDWLKNIQGNIEVIEASIPHYSWKEQWAFRKMIKNSDAQLLFSPHFNVPFFCPIPYVITIHDLILHWYPNQAPFIKRFAYKVLLSRAVRKAKKIITVSNFTYDQLMHVYGKRATKKASVIYEGVSELFYPQDEDVQKRVCEKFGLQKPFFLYVGNAKQHKNVQMLLDAFAALEDNSKELVLVCGGSEIKDLNIPNNVIMLRNVSDDELPALYSAAICFVTASLYEGFGLPIVEARACGCPVIASCTSAIPEVAGSGAILIKPTYENFKNALKNHPEKTDTSVSSFSWRKAADETYALLKSCFDS